MFLHSLACSLSIKPAISAQLSRTQMTPLPMMSALLEVRNAGQHGDKQNIVSLFKVYAAYFKRKTCLLNTNWSTARQYVQHFYN